MSLISFLSLNGEEITEQGRKISDSVQIGATEVELEAGIKKRYITNNKRVFSINWEWLPSIPSHTIDNRKSRNYLKNLAFTKNKVLVSIKLDHNLSAETFYAYINDYSETLVRRVVEDACDYYRVSMTFEEI